MASQGTQQHLRLRDAMTTIAATRKTIASDSLISDGFSSFRSGSKIHEISGGYVGYARDVHSCLRLVQWLKKPKSAKPEFSETDIATALVLKSGLLYYVDTTCILICIADDFAAIGSGASAALAAMHCGRSPSEAVKIASLVDMNSGLPVIEKRLI